MPELDLNNLVLNDINVDTITNSAKTGVFDKLMDSVNDNINVQYTNGRITSSDYANVYLGSLQAVLQQSIQFALQEQVSEAQISGILKDNNLKDAEISKSYNMQEAELEKNWGYAVTRAGDGSIILGASTALGKIDKDIEVTEKEVLLKQEQIESETLNNGTDGMIENQILKIKEDILVSKEQVSIAKTQAATEQANSIANIDKVLGYDYTLDGDNNIIVGVDTEDGKLDFEKNLVKEQTKATYTDTVLKDKQTAKLGLDNIMKLSEASRESDANFKYTPNYTDPGA